MRVGKESQEQKIPNRWGMIVVLLILAAMLLAYTQMNSPSGLVTADTEYEQKISETFTESTTKEIAFVEIPRSIKVSGGFTSQGGSAKVWIQTNGEKQLIFDSDKIDDKS